MKKFVIRVFAFVLIMAASLCICEVMVRTLPNPYKIKYKAMDEGAENVKTLILGNSHSYFGLRPDVLGPDAVNLANISQPLKYDRRLFEFWLPRLDNLQTVIMHLGYTSLFDMDLDDGSDWGLACNYRLYMDLDVNPWYSKYGAEFWNISVFKNKLGVRLGLQESKLDCDSLGHGESFCTANKYEGWKDAGASLAERHTSGQRCDLIGVNIREIDRIADICTSHGIKLVFVTMPEWETYRNAVDETNFNLFRHTVDSISKVRGIPWFYYWDDVRFNEKDFYDADHLTTDVGAFKMSRILRRDMGMD